MDALNAPMLLPDVALEPSWSLPPYIDDTPLIDVATLIAGARRAVVVAPHPEDHVLGSGGLLVEFADFGLDTQILVVTDGEASHDGSRQWTRATLRDKRVTESVQALTALGVDLCSVTRLRYPDGMVAAFEDELSRRIAAQLRPGDLVLTTWWDGNPDHAACNRAVEQAVFGTCAALREAPVMMWNWADAEDPLLPHDRMVRVALGTTALERKRRALTMFDSLLRADPDVAGSPRLDRALLAHFSHPFETLLYAPDV